MVPDKLMNAFSFRAKHHNRWGVVVNVVIILIASLVEPINPEAVLLHLIEPLRHIPNPDDRDIFESSRGCLSHRVGQTGCPPLGNHHCVRACRICSAYYGTQIMRVFHSIQQYDKLSIFSDLSVTSSGSISDYSLMRLPSRYAVESWSLLETDGNSGGMAKVHDFLYARASRALRDQHPVQVSA